MPKVAVRRVAGNVIGVMKGDYTLVPGYVEEDDTGQQPPIIPAVPQRIRLRNVVSGVVTEFEIVP